MRVLVVEDEPKMAALIRRGLREEGMAVDLAERGEDALWMAGSTEYDAIVLDVMLPGIDGFETCRRLREDGVWAPVLMLTARDAVEDRVAGLDHGADDYLIKPFSFAELLARLRALVRRGPVERPVVLEVGRPAPRPGHAPGHAATTPRSRSRRRSSRCSRCSCAGPARSSRASQLLEHAWDYDYENRSNVVDVYVRYLREKIDRPFGTESIETVRGVGYRLRSRDRAPALDPGPAHGRVRRRARARARARRAVRLPAHLQRAQRGARRRPRGPRGRPRRAGRRRWPRLARALGDPVRGRGGILADPASRRRGGRLDARSGCGIGARRREREPSGERAGAGRRGRYLEFDGEARVLAQPASSSEGDFVVVAGASTDDRSEALAGIASAFLIGAPLALLLAAALGYLLATRALAPVEALRLRADEITLRRSGDRLPLPEAEDELHRLAATLNVDARPDRGLARARAGLRRRREPRAANAAWRSCAPSSSSPGAPIARSRSCAPRSPRRVRRSTGSRGSPRTCW